LFFRHDNNILTKYAECLNIDKMIQILHNSIVLWRSQGILRLRNSETFTLKYSGVKEMKKETRKEVKKNDDVSVEENAKKVDQVKPFFSGLFIILVIAILCILLSPWWLSVVVLPVSAFLVLWFIWAPSMIIGIFIPEGCCVIITRGQEGGQFVKAMIKYRGYTINDNFEIIGGSEDDNETGFWNKSHLGMNFYLWPFDRVYAYTLEWKQFTHDEKVVKRKELLYRVLLKPYIYYIDIRKAEDKDKVPQKMGIIAEMRVTNIYKAIFRIQNWYRAVSNLIIGDLRDFIRTKSYEELINSQGTSLNEMIWDQRINISGGLAEKIEEKYGIEIIKLTVVEIGPDDEEYSRSTLRAIIAQKNQDAIKIEAGSVVIKRSAESMGLIMKTFALSVGKSEAEVASDYDNDPAGFEEKYGKRFAECVDLVQREMALSKGRFIDVRTDAAGIKGGDPLLALIAANSLMSNQFNRESSGQKISGENQERKKAKSLKEAGFDIDDDEDE
jgi:hypothetical protein